MATIDASTSWNNNNNDPTTSCSVSSLLSARKSALLDNECCMSSSASSGPTDDEGEVDEENIRPTYPCKPSFVAVDEWSPSSDSGGLTYLERIIRTHPIWYLPHIGRTAASHLLRPKEMGSFVIRASSKPNSMALSIRLPLGLQMDIDHYLVETLKNGTVRLEGSPNTFTALPLLLQHYSEHGEELQTKLRLALAVLECQTRRDLESLALLGQDFWTSEVGCSRCSSALLCQSPLPTNIQSSSPPPIPPKDYHTNYDNCMIMNNGDAVIVDDYSAERIAEPVARTKSASISEGSQKGNISTSNSFRMKKWFGNGNSNQKNGKKEEIKSPQGMSRVFPDASLDTWKSPNLMTDSVNFMDRWDCGDKINPQMSTFKPSNESPAQAVIKPMTKPRPLIKPKPAPRPGLLRREKSDLGGWMDNISNTKARINSIKQNKSSVLANYDLEDKTVGENVICVRAMSPKINLQEQSLITDAISKSKTNDSGLFRAWSGKMKNNNAEKRLSVPNLADAVNNRQPFNHSFNRRPGQAELPTINEGLVTPLARRKQLLAQSLRQKQHEEHENKDNIKKSLEDLLKAMFPGKQLEIPNKGNNNISNNKDVGPVLQRRYNSERMAVKNVEGAKKVGKKLRSSSSTLPGKLCKEKGMNTWSLVTDEIRVRHNVAKIPPSQKYAGSEYAQLSDFSDLFLGNIKETTKDDDELSVAGTVFNEPWDSTGWENLIEMVHFGNENEESPPLTKPSNVAMVAPTIVHNDDKKRRSLHEDEWNRNNVVPRRSTNDVFSVLHEAQNGVSRESSPTPVMTPKVPKLRQSSLDRQNNRQPPGTRMKNYIHGLSEDRSTVFGATVQQFVECTIQSEEIDPHVVLRNIRQFLNGLKNYLVKHGEGRLHELIESERNQLQPDQLLNIDMLLENLLHKIVLQPVKSHVYHLMVKQQSNAGTLTQLSKSLAQVRCLTCSDLRLEGGEIGAEILDKVKDSFRKMQHEYSPLQKLHYLLQAVHHVIDGGKIGKILEYGSTSKGDERKLPEADDLVRWIVLLLSRCSIVGAEMEATYMWALLAQPLLAGEASYYLTALFSAVHMLKSPDTISRLAQDVNNQNVESCWASVSSICNESVTSLSYAQNCEGFIKIALPNEDTGCIKYHTLPAIPMMNTHKLCRMIAHKAGITNSEDHGLYLLVDGFETCLMNNEFPEVIQEQLRQAGKQHMFAYKRHEAKIAWPKVAMSPRL